MESRVFGIHEDCIKTTHQGVYKILQMDQFIAIEKYMNDKQNLTREINESIIQLKRTKLSTDKEFEEDFKKYMEETDYCGYILIEQLHEFKLNIINKSTRLKDNLSMFENFHLMIYSNFTLIDNLLDLDCKDVELLLAKYSHNGLDPIFYYIASDDVKTQIIDRIKNKPIMMMLKMYE